MCVCYVTATLFLGSLLHRGANLVSGTSLKCDNKAWGPWGLFNILSSELMSLKIVYCLSTVGWADVANSILRKVISDRLSSAHYFFMSWISAVLLASGEHSRTGHGTDKRLVQQNLVMLLNVRMLCKDFLKMPLI